MTKTVICGIVQIMKNSEQEDRLRGTLRALSPIDLLHDAATNPGKYTSAQISVARAGISETPMPDPIPQGHEWARTIADPLLSTGLIDKNQHKVLSATIRAAIRTVLAEQRERLENAINDASEKPDHPGTFTRAEVIAAIRAADLKAVK